ncbi:hypothetical protein C2845_PM14G07510 [Panicum miliaceum]|uniref:Uncharacterized protein n=1 Tax=Panicum miliaceum TaxID=4540 RepID=A0A3L6PT06_PANMI|nr:hypothetical protein C2845_PM14G07510 [Panicum miliaceum]
MRRQPRRGRRPIVSSAPRWIEGDRRRGGRRSQSSSPLLFERERNADLVSAAVPGRPAMGVPDTFTREETSIPTSITWRRSRAISGPDSRLAPWNESTMNRALRQAKEQGGICIFYPSQGTTFNSCEEAKDFYNLYSWEVGFGIRYGCKGNKHINLPNWLQGNDKITKNA